LFLATDTQTKESPRRQRAKSAGRSPAGSAFEKVEPAGRNKSFGAAILLRAHLELTMHDPALDATFEAIEVKDGSVGYVSLARPEMLPQRIGEF
jgi:hypothetical protein